MSRLVVVQLEVCRGLQKVELVGLLALQQLHITACDALQILAGLAQLAALTQLKVERCRQLLTQEALPTTLQHLAINSCGKLTVPGLEGLVSLTELRLIYYRQLQEVRGFTALQQLAIWGSYSLGKVDLRGCTALKHVSLRNCYVLSKLSGVGQLDAEAGPPHAEAAGVGQQHAADHQKGAGLPTLDIRHCDMLKWVPAGSLEGDQVGGPAPPSGVSIPGALEHLLVVPAPCCARTPWLLVKLPPAGTH
jgi:hypothetical protein